MQEDFKVLTNVLNSRYSCRGYLDKEISEHDIHEIVAAASRVPTWCNAQPWQVHITRGDETQKFAKVLTEAAMNTQMTPDFEWPETYSGAYQDRRRECGYQLYESVGIKRYDRAARDRQMMENFRFFGAPHVAIITTEAELGPYAAMDSGGFIALFALAARAKGIGSVVQASVTGFAPTIREHFNIPENRLIQTAISFGYEYLGHPANGFRTSRADISDVIHFWG